MPVLLPDFADEHLRELTVCALFHVDDVQRFAGIANDDRIGMQVKYDITGGSAWARLVVERFDNDHGHVHFDIGRESESEYGEMTSLETTTIERLNEQLAPFMGQRVELNISGRFLMPFDLLPKRGMIATLLGLSTESCGAELELTGARMAITSDLFTSLQWSWDEDDDTVYAEIKAESDSEIYDTYLTDLARLMRHGAACFVFEQTDSRDYDADDEVDSQQTHQTA